MTAPKQSLRAIQALRALAALAVLIFHAVLWGSETYAPYTKSVVDISRIGAAGVILFFVISGFIMLWTTWDQFGASGNVRSFAWRRFIRIYPFYWVLLIPGVVLLAATSPSMPGPLDLLGAALLWPGEASTVLVVAWSLSYEMLFYVVFAAALRLPRLAACGVVTALFVGLVGAGTLVRIDGPVWAMVTNPMLLLFPLGFASVLLVKRAPVVPLPLLGAAIAAAFAIFAVSSLYHGSFPRVPVWGAASFLLVTAGVLIERDYALSRHLTPLVALGDSSYSLYLVHAIVLPLLAHRLASFGTVDTGTAVLIGTVLVLISVPVAHGVHLYVEQPLIRLIRSPRPQSLVADLPQAQAEPAFRPGVRT